MFIDTVIPVVERVAPVVAFLVTVTVLADVAQRVGVFDVAARWIAGWGRGRTFLLWWLFSVFAVVTTVFLSLDTTAVLLTPVALALARQGGVPVRPFAVTTFWIANTGSLLLPVSNLTNLMAVDRFARWGLGHGDYVALALWPGCVAIVVTLVCVVVMYPALVSGRYGVVPVAGEGCDRVLLLVGFVVCGAVGPAFAVGVEPWVVSSVGVVVLVGAVLVRDAGLLRGVGAPWGMALGFVVLSVLVGWVEGVGGLGWLGEVLGSAEGVGGLLRVAGVTALLANVVNNLPAYLAVEGVVSGDAVGLMAVLVGVNVGPLVTPWGSLATLLWLQRCSAAGVKWSVWRLGVAGVVCAGCAVVAATLVLGVVG